MTIFTYMINFLFKVSPRTKEKKNLFLGKRNSQKIYMKMEDGLKQLGLRWSLKWDQGSCHLFKEREDKIIFLQQKMLLNTYFTALENACIIDCQSPENLSCNLFKGDMKKNVELISISRKAITQKWISYTLRNVCVFI